MSFFWIHEMPPSTLSDRLLLKSKDSTWKKVQSKFHIQMEGYSPLQEFINSNCTLAAKIAVLQPFFEGYFHTKCLFGYESLLEASLSSCWTVGFPSQIRFLCSLVLPPSSNEVSLTRRRWVFLILSSKWVYFLFLWPASYINRTTGGSEYVTPLWHPKLWSHEGQLCPRSGWSFWGVKRPQSMYGNSHGRSFIQTADKRRV